MSDSNYNYSRAGRDNFSSPTGGFVTVVVAVIVIVVAVLIVVGASFAYNNSIGSDTSGDDTKVVVNNVPSGA
jgi:hypothetical protein